MPRSRWTLPLLAATALSAGAVFSATAQGATIPVLSTSDGGASSLRAAIAAANATTADDVIDIQVTGTIALTSAGLPNIDSAATGGKLTIQGPGATLLTVRRSFAALQPVLSTNNASDATFTGFSIENGGAGAISQFGTLKLDRMEVRDSSTPSSGGGIYVDTNEHLTLDRTTIAGNTSTGVTGGGGIYANAGAVLTITRSTISGNTSTAAESGAGITTFGAASTITASTIARNKVPASDSSDGANIYSQVGPLTLRETIVADPQSSTPADPANCRGFGGGTPLVSQGYNLADDASCSFGAPGDQPVADPGFLANTDFAPEVLPIAAGSPASDKIPAGSCSISSDQRGVARPQNGSCDIGAFEYEVVPRLAFSNPAPITILDAAAANPYPSTITVSGLPRPVTDVTVRLHSLSHTFPGDVGALLVGPQGQSTVLMSSPGDGRDAANATLTLNDAGQAISPDAPLLTGTYKPTAPEAFPFPAGAPAGPFGAALGAFDGTLANGTWRLFVADGTGGDQGNIADGWSLGIDTQAAPAKKCKKRKKKGKKAASAKKKRCKKPKRKKPRK